MCYFLLLVGPLGTLRYFEGQLIFVTAATTAVYFSTECGRDIFCSENIYKHKSSYFSDDINRYTIQNTKCAHWELHRPKLLAGALLNLSGLLDFVLRTFTGNKSYR